MEKKYRKWKLITMYGLLLLSLFKITLLSLASYKKTKSAELGRRKIS